MSPDVFQSLPVLDADEIREIPLGRQVLAVQSEWMAEPVGKTAHHDPVAVARSATPSVRARRSGPGPRGVAGHAATRLLIFR